MQIIEVTNAPLAEEFIAINPKLYKGDPNYIRPLNKDVAEVFDPAKNKSFRSGKICRWILRDDSGESIGRVAAFTTTKYKNKDDKYPTGCIGFFDCIDSQDAANLLFDTAKDWLKSEGMEAMDGPVNFGERDKWWGLLVDGFDPPLYGMNYNYPYYKDLFEHYGFQVFYYQNCYKRKVKGGLEDRFYIGHQKIEARGGFSARMVEKSNLKKYALDFVKVYNSAWAKHDGNKEMTDDAAIKLFNTMKPIIDERIAWFVYFKEEPVAFYINIPDLNQIFREFDGKFGWMEKLRFFIFQKFSGFKKMVGIIFGIVPRFQGLGVDYYMIVEAAKVIQDQSKYEDTELQWIGDWNPKMNNIAKHIGFSVGRRLATYRYLFDREAPFERHPFL
jgi:hypothetical protein